MQNHDWQERTKLLLGENHKKLSNANVLVVGLGGVGGMAAEMLCRAGIGKMTLIDGDTVHKTNLNRQIISSMQNIGQKKAVEFSKKLKSINPEIELNVINDFIKDQLMIDILRAENYDFVVDAIDTISPKVHLIYNSVNLGYRIISSMGAGGKLDPTKVKVTDISKSYNCPLARIVRKRLHKLGVYKGVSVVFSPEERKKESLLFVEEENKKTTLGTISYMPNIFGLYIAWFIIDSLIKEE